MIEGRVSVQLGDVSEIQTGFPFKSNEYSDDPTDPKLLRGDNIAQGRVRWDGVKRWPHSRTAEVAQYWLKEGDVIVAMDRPWIEAGLKYCAIQRDDLPCLLVQRVARLRGRKGLDNGFLRYLIGSQSFTDYVLAVQTGTAVPHISSKQIQSFCFDLPPLPEQRAIAATLGALDDKIEANRKMNATLEAMARALFRDWFVDFGPTRARMEGRAPYLSPDLWPLFPDRLDGEGKPEGWEVSPLGELAKVEWGNTSLTKSVYVENGYPAFSAAGQDGFVITPERKGLGVVISAIGTVGKIYLASGSWTAIKNTLTVQGHTEAVSAFVYYLLQETALPTRGSTQQFISLGDAKAVKVISPDHRFILAFFELVEPLIRKMVASAEESRTLASTRDLLLPKLMSGEVRVKDAEQLVGEAT